MAKVAITRDQLTPDQASSLKSYQAGLDADEQPVSSYKYLPGMPRQYRFDGKAGVFNIGGDEVLGKSLTFQPIAWQLFTDNILGMGVKDWAEIFFVDNRNCVSAVLFHGYSVDNLKKLIEPLYYDDLNLADVVLTATAEKKQNKDGGTYYMAFFSYKPANETKVAEMKEFVADVAIWRSETVTAHRKVTMSHGYALPMADEPQEALPEAEQQAIEAAEPTV